MTNFPKSTIFAVFAIIVNYNQVAADPQVDQGSLCRSHQYFDTEKNQCMDLPGGGTIISEDKVHNCADGVPRPHESEGRYYYVCKCDKTILAECPLGLRYDDGEKGCIQDVGWKTVRLVQDEYSFIQLPACLEPGLFPIPDYCSLYYSCNVTSSYLLQSISVCPPSTAFSPSLKICAFTESCSGDLVHLLANSVSRTQVLNTGKRIVEGEPVSSESKLNGQESPASSPSSVSLVLNGVFAPLLGSVPGSTAGGPVLVPGLPSPVGPALGLTPVANAPLPGRNPCSPVGSSDAFRVTGLGNVDVKEQVAGCPPQGPWVKEEVMRRLRASLELLKARLSQGSSSPQVGEILPTNPDDRQREAETVINMLNTITRLQSILSRTENSATPEGTSGSNDASSAFDASRILLSYRDIFNALKDDQKYGKHVKILAFHLSQPENPETQTDDSASTTEPISSSPLSDTNNTVIDDLPLINLSAGQADRTGSFLIEAIRTLRRKLHRPENVEPESSEEPTSPRPEDESHEEVPDAPSSETSGGSSHSSEETSSETPSASSPSFEELNQNQESQNAQKSVTITVESSGVKAVLPAPQPVTEPSSNGGESGTKETNQGSVNIAINTSESTTTPATVEETPADNQSGIEEIVERGEQQRENQQSVNIVIGSQETTTPAPENYPSLIETQDQDEKKEEENKQSVNIVINTSQSTTTPAPIVEVPVGNENEEIEKQVQQRENQQSVNIVIGSSETTTPAPEPYPSLIETQEQQQEKKEGENKQSVNIVIDTSQSTTTPAPIIEVPVVEVSGGNQGGVQEVVEQGEQQRENQQSVNIVIGSPETTTPAPEPSPSLIETQEQQQEEKKEGENKQSVNIVIDTSQSTTTPAPIIEVPVVEVPGGSQGEILEVVEQGEQQRENQPSVNIVINTSESTTTPGSIIVEESGVGGETQEIVNQEEEKKGEKQQSVEIVINTPQATTTPAPEVEGPVGNEGGTQQEVVRQEGQEEKQQSVNIVIGTSASTTPAPEPELYPSILEQGVTDQEHRQHEDERKQSITIEINSGSTTTPGTLLEEEDELLGHAAMTQNVRKKEVHEGENQQSVKITIGSTETTSPASQDYQPYEFEGGEHRQTHYLQSQSQHRLQQSHSHGLSSSWQSGYSSQFDQPLPTGQQWSSGGQHVTSYKKYVKQPGVSWSIMSPLYSTEPSTGSSGSFSSSYQHTKKVLRRITHPDGTVSTYYENGSNENPEESVANAHAESGYQESKTHHAERQQSVRILIGPQQTTTKPAPSKEQSGGSSSGLFGNFHKVLRKVVNPVGKVSTYYENGSSKNGEEAESTGDVTSEGENDQEESQASGGIFGNILHYPKKVLRKVVNPDGSLSTFWSRSVQKMSGGSAERESEGSNSYSHHGLNINGGVSLGDFRVGGGFSLKKSSNAGTTLGSAGGSSYQAHHGQNIHMTTHSAGSTKNVSYVLSSGSSAPAHAKISLNGGSFPATLDVSENGNAHGSQHAGSSSAYGSASSQAHSFGGHFSKSHHVQTSHSSHTGYQGTKIVRRKWFRFKGHCSGVGIFRVPNSCSGYYECTLNDQNLYTISSVKFCPACLRFNPQLGRCDFPLNVPECSDGKSESRNCTGEGSFPHSELSSVYYVCSKTPDEITLETRTCPIGQAFDKTVGKCNDNPKDKSQPQECEDLTDLPDNFDCSRYYSCEQLQEDGDLEKVAKTCPSGFYFNSDSDTCSRPDEISGFPAETLIDIRHST